MDDVRYFIRDDKQAARVEEAPQGAIDILLEVGFRQVGRREYEAMMAEIRREEAELR